MNIWIFIGVLIATFLADVFWTLYFINVQANKSLLAAFWSSMIVCCGAFTIMSYKESWIYSIASVIGAFLGTYATMIYKNRNKD